MPPGNAWRAAVLAATLMLPCAPARAAEPGDADSGVESLTLSDFLGRTETPGIPAHSLDLPQLFRLVCSPLDFSHVNWPPELTLEDRQALTAALSLSGSYEGNEGWANLTGNFDGQGVSLGLLNQNLGQGSLQPLLIKLRDRHPEVLRAAFDPTRLASLLGMLSRWESSATSGPEETPSRLDEPKGDQPHEGAARNDASAGWAAQTLYKDSRFEPAWKKGLTALAVSPEYVSIQIEAALWLHERALVYEARVGVRELRAYLLMFDFAVQNGSIYSEDFADYDAYVKTHPKAGSAEKLEALLGYRLRHVRQRFVEDVRSRKMAIIRGTGVVHGERRNLPKEYCFDPLAPYR